MSAGTIFTEIDLDSRKFDAAKNKIIYDAKTMAVNVEDAWKTLGRTSDTMFNMMRQQATNAFERIKGDAKSSSAEIIRAEEAKNAKLKALNEEQYGAQTSLIDSLKKNWMALSAATIAAYMIVQRAFSTGREIASMTNDIERQARVVGMSTDEFQKWQYAAKMSDVEAESLGIGLKMLSKNMESASSGSGDAARYFSAMGISVKTTDGYLRPLNEVMGDVMDKFASWTDGPRKIAISMELFGRSGETLIPLLNKGRAGFNEFATEAERLGIILDPNLIKAGSHAEDVLKRLESQVKATKLSMAPLVDQVATGVEDILSHFNKLDSWLKRNKITNWFPWMQDFNNWIRKNSIEAWKVQLGFKGPDFSKSYESWSGEYSKIQPPEVGKAGKLEDLPKTLKDNWESFNPTGYIKIYTDGILTAIESSSAWNETEKIRLATEEKLKAIEGDIAQQMADDMFPSIDKVNKMIDQGNVYFEEQRVKLIQIQNLVKDFGWEDYASGAVDASNDATRTLTQMANKTQVIVKETSEFMKGLGNTISSSISGAMSGMIMGTQSAAEALKQIWSSIASYVIEQIAKMMVEWLLFEKTTQSGGKSGLNLLGIASSAITSLVAPDVGPSGAGYSGGYVPAYVSGGNAGQNAMRSGGSVQVDNRTTNMYINAIDVESFEKKYGNSIMKINRKSYRLAGDMKNMTR